MIGNFPNGYFDLNLHLKIEEISIYIIILNKCVVVVFFHFSTDSPVCVESGVTVVGASLDESISIPCRVNADPPDVEFEWSFSSSGERFEVPHGHYTTVQDVNVNGADGSRGASMFYDSEETHGESDGSYNFLTLL